MGVRAKSASTEVNSIDSPGKTSNEQRTAVTYDQDELQLARLGYRQEFLRCLGMFENWAATFINMNVACGIPILFGWVMGTGGPEAAFANWTMVGGLSVIVSLALAEIAAAYPTAGSIYYYAYRLGGGGADVLETGSSGDNTAPADSTTATGAAPEKAKSTWGPFLCWMTGWWSWAAWICVLPGAQQGATNFLIGALQIRYPDAEVLSTGWLAWIITAIGLVLCMLPNVYSPGVLKWYFRFAVASFFTLLTIYWIYFPIAVATSPDKHFQSGMGAVGTFYNGINTDPTIEPQASDGYCWVISILFGAWIFFGYDSSAHLAEETVAASRVVARGMYFGTLFSWLVSVPTLLLILFCMQDFQGIIAATYANNWAEYLIQIIGEDGAVAILVLLWIDATCAATTCFLSAQRVTYAISRDRLLPGSKFFHRLNSKRMAQNAAYLVLAFALAISTAMIGSSVAFSALTATATIAINVSYLIPIVARQTVARKSFRPAPWNLGKFSPIVGLIASLYICFLFCVLLLPQLYPVTPQNLNYAPIMIGGISVISLAGWFCPRFGGRHWFHGPVRMFTERELSQAQLDGSKDPDSTSV